MPIIIFLALWASLILIDFHMSSVCITSFYSVDEEQNSTFQRGLEKKYLLKTDGS